MLKLRYSGYLMGRTDSLEKTLMLGKIEGRRRGWQRMGWLDGITDSMHHRWKPTRLRHPWDSPGKNTGVGCHFLLQCMKVKSEREVAQSCRTLSGPMDCSLPVSSVHGIFWARVLEWGAIAFSELNKQGDNIQPWCTPFPIWNQSVVPSTPPLSMVSGSVSQRPWLLVDLGKSTNTT